MTIGQRRHSFTLDLRALVVVVVGRRGGGEEGDSGFHLADPASQGAIRIYREEQSRTGTWLPPPPRSGSSLPPP